MMELLILNESCSYETAGKSNIEKMPLMDFLKITSVYIRVVYMDMI